MNTLFFPRWNYIYILAVCVFILAACAPAATPAPEAIQTEAEVAEPAATEAPAEVTEVQEEVLPTPPPDQVTFVSWAIDSVELRALVKMVEAFTKKEPGIKVNCIVMARAEVVSATSDLNPDVCKIVAK